MYFGNKDKRECVCERERERERVTCNNIEVIVVFSVNVINCAYFLLICKFLPPVLPSYLCIFFFFFFFFFCSFAS